MNPSENLFELIRSLTTSERRYLRLQFDGLTPTPLYIRLYELVLEQTQYDESKIKAALAQYPEFSKLTPLKNYLFHQLMRHLRHFNTPRDVRRQCLNALDGADLLLQRHLPGPARLESQRALRLARTYHLTDLFPAVLQQTRQLAKATDQPDWEASEEAERLALEQLDHETSLRGLYDRLLSLSRRRKEATQGLEAFEQHPLLQQITPQLTFTARLAWHLSWAQIHRMKGDRWRSHVHYVEALTEWERQPTLIKAFPDRFARAVTAYLYSCHGIGDFSEFAPLLKRIQERSGLPRPVRSQLALTAHQLQLLHALNDGPLSAGEPAATALTELLATTKVNPASLIAVRVNLALYHFMLGQLKRTHLELKQVMDLPRSAPRADLRELARALDLIVQHEREERDLLPYQLRSMLRYILRRRDLNAVDRAVRDFIQAVDRDPAAEMGAVQVLRRDLEGVDLVGARELRWWAGQKMGQGDAGQMGVDKV